MKSLRVHRVNFFEPDRKSIRCLSYDSDIKRLAVSRSDSSIEIWDIQKNAYLEKVIPSITNTSVETIAWCKGRLFSAGLFGYVYEYDLSLLTLKYQLIVTSGCPVWCMAVNKQKTCLATGNEDGHVVLHDFSLDTLDFQKKFDKQEGCILCLAWHNDGHIIVTGSMDTIRVWNVESGHVVNRIILGRSAKNTATIVWCISILSDMTIVSGDSCGKTSFWDGNTGTLISNLTVHKEDVLAVCVSKDEDAIYTSGVDPVLQMFVKSPSNGKWLKSVQRIVHTHDIRALQLVGDFLVSGGDDCNLVFTKYPPKTTIKYFPFCQMSYSVVAPLASYILLRYSNYLEVWKIGKTLSGSNSPQKLLQVKAKANEVIMCSSISADGEWLAYSSQFQMRLFTVHMVENVSPSISKIPLPDDMPRVASVLLFASKPTRLIYYSKGHIYIVRCDKDSPKLEGTIAEDQESAGQAHLLELSCNNLYLACGSYNGNVIIYSLETLKVLSKLPLYRHQPTAMKFDPTSENLLVSYSDRKVIEYSIRKQAYTKWSKKQVLLNLQDSSFYPITSIVCNLDRIYFQDQNCIYIFNKSEQSLQPDQKRLKSSLDSSIGSDGESFTSVSKYEHISSIHDFQNDLVVVQMSSSCIESSLPPPIWKKKYGT